MSNPLSAYFQSAYPFANESLSTAFTHFLNTRLSKGPYRSAELPYAPVSESLAGVQVLMPTWDNPFPPYHHQYEAFKRLSVSDPKPTILTTGTGSGKTESFLYPLLDYCRRCALDGKRAGIKAIVLYPMNALATDQAKRFAEACHRLARSGSAKVTVGLLIGEGKGQKSNRSRAMSAESVIEDSKAIRASPPDILLTNFKMLDYALMRDGLNEIWRDNYTQPDLLKYVVLDELHTYDGAQGTDVANLLRRLKLKLEPAGGAPIQFVPVGTSATVGDAADGAAKLAHYASKLFGEAIDESAIIGEKRLDLDTFFEPTESAADAAGRLATLEDFLPRPNETHPDYLLRQLALWDLPQPIDDNGAELAKALRSHALLASTIRLLRKERAGAPVAEAQLREALAKVHPVLADERFPAWLDSLFALVPLARPTPKAPPMLYLRSQLWLRELSGVRLAISEEPKFLWRDEQHADSEAPTKATPAFNCRDCGAGGWIVNWLEGEARLTSADDGIFNDFFRGKKTSWFMLSDADRGYQRPELVKRLTHYAYQLDALHLTLTADTENSITPAGSFAVRLVQTLRADEKSIERRCPCCGSKGGVAILGGRKALLTSILAGSILRRPALAEGKLLAFSNAVQDAAHIAGYAEARSYNFMLRNAMVQALPETGAVTLDELARRFADVQESRISASGVEDIELAYVATFFPADKEGKVDYLNFRQNKGGQFDRALTDELQHRISYEIIAEFGLRADRGRTLLRTGAAGIQLAEEPLRLALPDITALAAEHGLADLSTQTLHRFAIGALHHFRTLGAVDHPFLEQYRRVAYSTYLLNWVRRKDSPPPRHFLNPGYGGGRYAPRVVTPDPVKGSSHVESLSRPTSTLRRYFVRAAQQDTLGAALRFDDRQAADFLADVLTVLAKAGILNRVEGKAGTNYALDPRALEIAHPAMSVDCDCCPFTLAATAVGAEQLDGVTCFRESCSGSLSTHALVRQEYYSELYESPRVQRVFAADHTGMLERDTREALEHDFKQRPRPDSINLLVATSTLEMGIDIGDLNVVLNTMVPPSTANYLQRIGRAGRASGTAEVLNIAAASKAHDLYYYEDPYEMMSGGVETPGCYLEARDILRRHFYAYILDNFTEVSGNKIQETVRDLKLHLPFGVDHFVTHTGAYIASDGERLLLEMRKLYTRLEPDNYGLVEGFVEVEAQLSNGSIERGWHTAFAKTKDEFDRLSGQLREINKQVNALPKGIETQQHVELQLAKENLIGSRNRLRKRRVLEHLTNLGILPNYAFPETGVTLDAQIVLPSSSSTQLKLYGADSVLQGESERLQANDKRNRKQRRKEFEIVRPARSALREMMPEQSFYTQGYELPVTSLVIEDFREQSAEMAFCSRCDHLVELEAKQATSGDTAASDACPKCGDSSFGSGSNRHRFFRPTGVRAFANASKARIRDNKDERANTLTINQHHITLPKPRGARILNEVPFGVELNSEVTIKHVNLGPQVARGPLTIAGTVSSTMGYITCKQCGMSTTETEKLSREGDRIPKVAADYHLPYCRKRTEVYMSVEDETFAHLFFYSELKTEAIRILLPVSDFHSLERVALFKSGLLLGIRKHFGGAPDHLEFIDYVEYADEKPQRFLVLYDKVPGGTGYLDQIFDKKTFNSILIAAYSQIRACLCINRNKDGCYRCVLSYNFRAPELLSRIKAESLFKDICSRLDDWRDLPMGFQEELGATVQIIEESELEEQFVALWKLVAQRPGSKWSFAEELDEVGDRVYRLMYTSEPTQQLVYRMRAQPRFIGSELADVSTRPDFLIELLPEACRGIVPTDYKPMVVYLDGYGYHASAQHSRFKGDVHKRVAIMQKGNYIVWTLTYNDVSRQLKSLSEEPVIHSLDILAMEVGRGEAAQRMELFGPLVDASMDWISREDSFGRLRGLLEVGIPVNAAKQSIARMLVLSQEESTAVFGQVTSPAEVVTQLRSGWKADTGASPQRQDFWPAVLLPSLGVEHWSLRAATSISSQEVVWRLSAKPEPDGHYEKSAWELSWQMLNLLMLATLECDVETSISTAIDDITEFHVSCLGSLASIDQSTNQGADTAQKPAHTGEVDFTPFEELAETFQPDKVDSLRSWFEAITIKGWTEGVDYVWGGELVVGGEVLAQAELVAARHKLAIDPSSARDSKAFKDADYRVLNSLDDTPNNVSGLWD